MKIWVKWTKVWSIVGPKLSPIGPKEPKWIGVPILIVENQDFGSLYVFENTHHYQCIHKIICAYTSENLGQVDQNWVKCWAKFEPNWAQKSPIGPNWTGVPILIIKTCIVLIIMTTLRAYLKWPCEYIISFELTPVKCLAKMVQLWMARQQTFDFIQVKLPILLEDAYITIFKLVVH